MAFAVLFLVWFLMLTTLLIARGRTSGDPLPARRDLPEIDLDIRALMERVGRN